MYGVEAQKVGRLGDFSDELQQAAEQKFRGEHADGLKAIQAGHAQRLKAAGEKAKAEAAAAALTVMEGIVVFCPSHKTLGRMPFQK